LCRHLCRIHNGVIALVALVTLPTLHRRYPLVALASLSLSH
jgi:hypothetical protein